MLVCADALSLPNCFVVIFQKRHEYQNVFGTPSLVEEVAVGDTLAFYEPSPSDEKLGEHLQIIKTPNMISAINPQIANLPRRKAQKTIEPGKTVAWYNTGKTIKISNGILIVGSQRISCSCLACDRQSETCKGCFGRDTALTPLVYCCKLQIENEPEFDNDTGRCQIQDFRSLKFTKLLFKNLETIANLPEESLHSIRRKMNRAIDKLISTVNADGGWTVIGWFRRAAYREIGEPGQAELITSTLSHVVRLEPTNRKILTDRKYTKLMIRAENGKLNTEDQPDL